MHFLISCSIHQTYINVYLFFFEETDNNQFLKLCESLIPVANERGFLFLLFSCIITGGGGSGGGRVGLSIAIPVHWIYIDLQGIYKEPASNMF